jgi:hypothetical protein
MSYIGRGLQSGAFRQLDDISSGFDGSDTTHTMQVNSTNVTVGDVNQILLSLGGVIQKPGTDFTVSGSVLTFTTAPAANTSFFAVLLGSDNGGTVTPTDKSVTVGKIDINGGELFLDADDDTSITADTDDQIDIKIAGADDFQFTANTFTAQSGSTITTPTLGVGNTKDLGDGIHIKISDTGASTNTGFDELVIEKDSNCGISILSGNDDGGALIFGDDGDNDIGNIFYNHNGDYMAFNVNAAETMRITSIGAVTKPLQPCFRVGNGTQNDIAVTSNVTVIFSNEIFDTNSDFNTGTYTFTAPVTGKYFFTVSMRLGNVDSAASYLQSVLIGSNRNTTLHTLSVIGNHIDADTEYSFTGTSILDMDANDTAYVRIRIQVGTAQTDLDTDGSYFMGYLIG